MISIVIISILFVIIGWQMFYKKMWYKDLSVRFSFGHNYVYAGESAKLKEIIENRKKLPVTPVEVRFRIKKGISFQETDNTSVSDFVYKRDIYALRGRQRITRTLHMLCKKRGYYQIEDVSALSYALLHNEAYRMEIDTDASFYVFAKRVDVSDILRACQQMLGEQESQQKYLEDPFAFASIREYTMQDPMKSINWKASAKTGGLMVNTYTSMRNEQVMIYLDVEDRAIYKMEHLKEESISIAATLFGKLVSKGAEVGICINVKTQEKEGFYYCSPSRNKLNWTETERFLSGEWKEEDVVDFETILEIPYGDALPIIISKETSEKRLHKAESMLKNHTKGIWVVPVSSGDTWECSSEKFLFVKREVEKV